MFVARDQMAAGGRKRKTERMRPCLFLQWKKSKVPACVFRRECSSLPVNDFMPCLKLQREQIPTQPVIMITRLSEFVSCLKTSLQRKGILAQPVNITKSFGKFLPCLKFRRSQPEFVQFVPQSPIPALPVMSVRSV